jgi:putative nucleotidyltransferase with HDIG domain
LRIKRVPSKASERKSDGVNFSLFVKLCSIVSKNEEFGESVKSVLTLLKRRLRMSVVAIVLFFGEEHIIYSEQRKEVRSLLESLKDDVEKYLKKRRSLKTFYLPKSLKKGKGRLAVYLLPLRIRRKGRGLLILAKEYKRRLYTLQMQYLYPLADIVSLLITERIRAEWMIKGILSILELKDPSLYKHSQNVAHLAKRVAQSLHLPQEEVERVQQAAFLHDIGKMGVGEALLKKRYPLSFQDRILIRRHLRYGERILKEFTFFEDILPYVYYHHEWFNGKGYPEGRRGEEIPLGARIIAVVDAFEAMTSTFCTRAGLKKEEALSVLRKKSGEQFDPKVVKAFCALF